MTPQQPPPNWTEIRARVSAAQLLEARILARLQSGTLRTLGETARDMLQLVELRHDLEATLWEIILEAGPIDARKPIPETLYNRDQDRSRT